MGRSDDTDGTERRQSPLFAGRYRLLSRIGRGGMGAVHRAIHEATDRPVAIKLLHPELAEDSSARERFKREAKAPAAIDHPAIVDVLDAGVHEGVPFIAMELLEGTSLRAALRSNEMTVGRALQHVADVLEPLAAAHASGFVHRDLKPSNVFVGVDGAIKLLDFGISRRAVHTAVTKTGALLGTIRYVSPEQVRAPRSVGPTADVWSVGVMLYEIVAGNAPFRGEPARLLRAAASEPHLPLREVTAKVSAPFAALVDDCLAKDPARRPADAGQVLTRLRAAMGQMDDLLAQPVLLGEPATEIGRTRAVGGQDSCAVEESEEPSLHRRNTALETATALVTREDGTDVTAPKTVTAPRLAESTGLETRTLETQNLVAQNLAAPRRSGLSPWLLALVAAVTLAIGAALGFALTSSSDREGGDRWSFHHASRRPRSLQPRRSQPSRRRPRRPSPRRPRLPTTSRLRPAAGLRFAMERTAPRSCIDYDRHPRCVVCAGSHRRVTRRSRRRPVGLDRARCSAPG